MLVIPQAVVSFDWWLHQAKSCGREWVLPCGQGSKFIWVLWKRTLVAYAAVPVDVDGLGFFALGRTAVDFKFTRLTSLGL
jgi:hypothetical protein